MQIRTALAAAIAWMATGLVNAASAGSQDGAPPPPAPAKPFTYAVAGVPVSDPYRWLENNDDKEAKAWFEAERTYAEVLLKASPGLPRLIEEIGAEFDSAPSLGAVAMTPQRTFLVRWRADGPSIFAVEPGAGSERLLCRPTPGVRINAMSPSWGGAAVAIATTAQGDAAPEIRLVDAETGDALPDRIPDLLTTTSGSRYRVAWLPDDRGFIYPRLAEGARGGPSAERLARGRQYLHRLGDSQTDDRAIWGFGVVPSVEFAPEDLPSRVVTASGSRWVVASILRSEAARTEYWAAPLGEIGEPGARWRRIDEDADLERVQIDGDTVYAIARSGEGRGALVKRRLDKESARWRALVEERDAVMTAFNLQRDAIYLTERADGEIRLLRVRKKDGAVEAIETPARGAVYLSNANPAVDGVMFDVESWASPPDWHSLPKGAAAAVEPPFDDGVPPQAVSEFVFETLLAPASDGALIPVSLLRRKDLPLDGKAPLLMQVYGSHGVAVDPTYDPAMAVWVRNGGVFAFAHVRGGGERGKAWHEAGRRENKRRGVEDAADATRHLIAQGYGAAGRVTLYGISAGAAIPGLMPAVAPELYSTLIFDVGQPDEIRGAALDPSAARNLAEFGDLDTPEGVRLLLRNSPYHSLPDAVELPAVIVKSARADYNFGGEATAAKFVARLRAANTGSNPILWMSVEGGHDGVFTGLGPEISAQVMAFAFAEAGHPLPDGRQDRAGKSKANE